ncbi:GNAT family N-acetyltransferase [Vibrio astriarenae]|uniref:GNAT family N-acetyltransferase n=1 Tax=Vibrio astriarenae TaxID=1481923 RepID=A0A7Z2T613_9VIBR|nr:GNAT family N-acetyltransferase [Vibrio astriarenae]QIA64901.1 GNAT family N-acetyltransferase [Vibrio astriarenae]
MKIKVDDLQDGAVIALLEEHLQDMYAVSPPESVHALDVSALKSDTITFFSGWLKDELTGCVAIKVLSDQHVELKSMRTVKQFRNSGVASKLLKHAIDVAKQRGVKKVSLETGSENYFKPARTFYEKSGFAPCAPFADYKPDPFSCFMTMELD